MLLSDPHPSVGEASRRAKSERRFIAKSPRCMPEGLLSLETTTIRNIVCVIRNYKPATQMVVQLTVKRHPIVKERSCNPDNSHIQARRGEVDNSSCGKRD